MKPHEEPVAGFMSQRNQCITGLAFAQDARNRKRVLGDGIVLAVQVAENVFQGGVTDDVLTLIAGNPFRAGVPEHDLSRAVDEVHSCRHVFQRRAVDLGIVKREHRMLY